MDSPCMPHSDRVNGTVHFLCAFLCAINKITVQYQTRILSLLVFQKRNTLTSHHYHQHYYLKAGSNFVIHLRKFHVESVQYMRLQVIT